MPRIPFITDKFIGNDKIQAAALRYYLKKTLNESPSISALRRKLNFDLDKGNLPLNSQTRARLREITNEVQKSEAQMDKMAENLMKMSDDEIIKKEMSDTFGVVYKGENAALIYKDLKNLENALLLEKGDKNKGGTHIRLKHTKDTTQQGFVTPDEVENIGQNVRKYLKEHKEPFIDKDGARLYEWQDEQGVNFRLVARDKVSGADTLPTSANEEIITFYSSRNLKDSTNFEFKNKSVAKSYETKPKETPQATQTSTAQSTTPNAPQKSLLEQIEEKEAELMRLKEMAKNADENAQKQGLNADESLTKKENERFEEVLEKPAQKETQNEPTQDIDKALKAQDEPKETPSIEKESLQLDEMPSQKVNKLFDEILTPNYYQNEKAVFYENMIKNAEKLAQNDKSITSNNIKAMLNTNERVVIDKLDTQEALNLGFKDYENVKRTIDSDEIRHALKEHGENSVGAKNGKPFIDENDIANYPQITKTADEQLITKTKQNLPARVSFKQINGYYVIVEEVHNGQGELAFKTMFKENGDYKNSNAYKQATANPLFPHKTQGGNSLGSDEIIPNSKGQSQVDFKALSELMQNIEAKYEKAFNLNTIEKMTLNHIFEAHTALERLAKSLKDNTSKISEKDALEVSKFINENLGLKQTLSDELLRRWGDKSLKKILIISSLKI